MKKKRSKKLKRNTLNINKENNYDLNKHQDILKLDFVNIPYTRAIGHKGLNHIYFYPSEIKKWKVTKPIVMDIQDINNHHIEAKEWTLYQGRSSSTHHLYVEPNPIVLHINVSEPINYIDAITAMDSILLSTVPVYTIIEGGCLDATILLSIVGNLRFIYRNAHITLSAFEYRSILGLTSSSKVGDDLKNLVNFKGMIETLIRKYTKLSDKLLKRLFKRDILLNAEEALKYGFVDKIVD